MLLPLFGRISDAPLCVSVNAPANATMWIYDRLSRGGMPYDGDYPGIAVELPDGGFVGIRNADTDNPTIDVNIPGIRAIAKLHFLVAPTHRHAGGNDGADAGTAHRINRYLGFAQGTDDAEVRKTSGTAAR